MTCQSMIVLTFHRLRCCHHQLSVIMLCVLVLSWVRVSNAKPQASNNKMTTVIEDSPSIKDSSSLVVMTTDATLSMATGNNKSLGETLKKLTSTPKYAERKSETKSVLKDKVSKKERLRRRKSKARLKFHSNNNNKLQSAQQHSRDGKRLETKDSHYNSANSKEDLYTRLLELESHLLKETVRSRELQETISRHADWLRTINSTVTQNRQNYTSLETHVDRMEHILHLEEDYHKSIENKLASVMLDVAEVNNLLSTQDKRNSVTLKDKMIDVQTPSEQAACSVMANTTKYRDCEEVYHHGHTTSGVYYITPLYASCPLPVYCDMDTPPGGWLVTQRRQDGSTDFLHDWAGYRRGFGDITDEFWLGNDNLFLLTNQGHYQLRVDLWDFYGSRVYADYLHFKVEGERDRYRLHVSNHSGTAPDSLANHNRMYFSTPDRDNDQYQQYHCAKEWSAGWWFSNCWFAFLNGQYHNTTEVEYRGISWNDWKTEQLKKVEMKIRPSGF